MPSLTNDAYASAASAGFVHAAYTFRNEADVMQMDLDHGDIQPGILVKLVQRGLQYLELEANAVHDDGALHDPKFEILTAGDILRTTSPASLKSIVQERRDSSTTTTQTKVWPEAREAAECGEELDTDADAVFSARWNPEGTRLACYTQGVQCSIWDVGPCGSSGKGTAEARKIVLRRGGSAVGASAPLVWSPDGLQVGMGLDDGWVCIWDPEGVLSSSCL
jgi:WD40 repeat protein